MKSASVELLDQARKDLVDGYLFYEAQQEGLGEYFLEHLYEDLEALRKLAGIHRKNPTGYYRMLARKFPYAIYYKLDQGVAQVYAVIDCRRDPNWIRSKLI